MPCFFQCIRPSMETIHNLMPMKNHSLLLHLSLTNHPHDSCTASQDQPHADREPRVEFLAPDVPGSPQAVLLFPNLRPVLKIEYFFFIYHIHYLLYIIYSYIYYLLLFYLIIRCIYFYFKFVGFSPKFDTPVVNSDSCSNHSLLTSLWKFISDMSYNHCAAIFHRPVNPVDLNDLMFERGPWGCFWSQFLGSLNQSVTRSVYLLFLTRSTPPTLPPELETKEAGWWHWRNGRGEPPHTTRPL